MPPIDDDKTVIPTTPGSLGEPGDFVSSSSFFGHTLPEGTRIGEFVVKGLIGEGGFGIVYLAYDPSLQRHVALKEYMPASLAGRASGGLDVVVKSERHRDTFKAGLKSFVNEARLLARFDHRSLVKVYRFWEDHGTAYMVMPFYEGPTLKRALAERATPPDEAALRAWLEPLLDALAVMHEAHCFHRDIAPDNILLTPSGPLLLDFGAARRVIGDMTQALTVMLKPGYAPIEQYGESAAMAQGAWTDLYAMGSVVYCAITGQAPMSSVERLMSDTLVPLRIQAAGRYSEPFLRAIDAALALRPKDRPQDVAQWRAMLDAALPRPPVPAPAAAPPVSPPPPPPPLPPAPAPRPIDAAPRAVASPALPAARPAAPMPMPMPMPVPVPVRPDPDPTPFAAAPDEFAWSPDDAPPPARRPASRQGLKLLGAAVVLAALAATPLLFTMQPDEDTSTAAPPPPAPDLPAATPPAAAAPQAPAIEPEPVPAPVATPAPVADTPAPAVTAEPPASAPAPVTVAPAPVRSEPAATPAPPVQPRAAPAQPPAVATRPAPKPAPRPAAEKTGEPPPRAQNLPPKTEANSSKCSDILQKASLEALTADETAYLRKECR